MVALKVSFICWEFANVNDCCSVFGSCIFSKELFGQRLCEIRTQHHETQTELGKVIGIVKRDYDDSKVYITPTMKEIDELMEVKPEIIAVDATSDLRPNGVTIDEFYKEIRLKYPDQLLMADCSTVEEALHADELGFDFIGTTLVGYTKQSKGMKIEENDFEIIRTILEKSSHKVIAEGNINTPEKAKRVIELGCYSVVVGSIITRPQLITKSFTEAIDTIEKEK